MKLKYFGLVVALIFSVFLNSAFPEETSLKNEIITFLKTKPMAFLRSAKEAVLNSNIARFLRNKSAALRDMVLQRKVDQKADQKTSEIKKKASDVLQEKTKAKKAIGTKEVLKATAITGGLGYGVLKARIKKITKLFETLNKQSVDIAGEIKKTMQPSCFLSFSKSSLSLLFFSGKKP